MWTSNHCPDCRGAISSLGNCIECGRCVLCYPDYCTCVYEEEDPQEYWAEDWGEDEPYPDEVLWGFPETGYLGPEIVSRETIGVLPIKEKD